MLPDVSATIVYVPRVSPTPGDPPRPAGKSGPVFYQITAFTLGPRVYEILCMPFKSEVSISINPEELLRSSPAGLQSQVLFMVPDPWAGRPYVGLRTLTPV